MTFSEKYPNETLRALSWKQPYASLMLHGKVETRTWHTKYNGWVLICASKQPYHVRDIKAISGRQFIRAIESIGGTVLDHDVLGDAVYMQKELMPLGQAIAIGKLSLSQRMGNLLPTKKGIDVYPIKLDIENKTFVQYNPNLYMHTYVDVQPIVPFDWKGKQGWSTVSEEVKSEILLL